jgi:hypothetical protein
VSSSGSDSLRPQPRPHPAPLCVARQFITFLQNEAAVQPTTTNLVGVQQQASPHASGLTHRHLHLTMAQSVMRAGHLPEQPPADGQHALAGLVPGHQQRAGPCTALMMY